MCVYIYTCVYAYIYIYIKSAFCLSTQFGFALFTSLPHFQEETKKFVFCVLLEDCNSMLRALHFNCLFQYSPSLVLKGCRLGNFVLLVPSTASFMQ